MLVFECPLCKTQMLMTVGRAADPTVCPACLNGAGATTEPARAAMPHTPGQLHLREDGDDDDGITKPENVRPAKKRRDDDDDDDDDDRPRKKRSSGPDAGTVAAGAVAGAGMGIGMILLIVVGITGCCVCLPIIGVGALMIPAIQKVREAAANAQAINNARQISLACMNFHDQNRHFPTPKMTWIDPTGKPLTPDLSWRVNTLPFVEQGGLFNSFDKTQGWDGPKNIGFKNRMPIFPFGSAADPGNTSDTKFQYFTGPNTPFPDPFSKCRIPQDVPDGTSNTFLFAEGATSVIWTKPADMVVGPGALPLPEGRFVAGMMDGSARIVRRDTARDDVLRMIINPRDGQAPPPIWGH